MLNCRYLSLFIVYDSYDPQKPSASIFYPITQEQQDQRPALLISGSVFMAFWQAYC
jgi:hypothetical protein